MLGDQLADGLLFVIGGNICSFNKEEKMKENNFKESAARPWEYCEENKIILFSTYFVNLK